MSKSIRATDRTWVEIEQAIQNNAIAILPIAAACKQHGKHLPMSTDYIQAEWLVDQIVSQINAVIWPTVSYGYYPAFVNYPGSCNLNEKTFRNMVSEIINNIVSSGATNIFVLNTGISTIPPLNKVINYYKGEEVITLINVYSGRNFAMAENSIKQEKYGSHADEIETSIMLAIAPDKVNMALAETCTKAKLSSPFNRCHEDKPNYTPSGVYGDARLATKQKGKILIKAMLKDVLHSIDEKQ